MKKLHTALFLSAVIILSAAAFTASAADLREKGAALYAAAGGKDYLIMQVPSTGSFISNKLVVASIRSGTETPAAQQIAASLQQAQPVYLAVTSDNDAVGAATLGRALGMVKGKAVTAQEVAFIGDREYEAELAAKAGEAGIKLLYVPVQ